MYRPISILSTIGIILESFITTKITTFLEAHHLRSKQIGFRQSRSAADLVHLQFALCNHALDRGKKTFVVALDITGAFDRVQHQVLLAKLRSLDVCGPQLQFIEDYLQHRVLKLVVNGHKYSQHPIN